MSDNRPAAADDRSLVRVPCRWCVAAGGALSFCAGVVRAIMEWKGGVL